MERLRDNAGCPVPVPILTHSLRTSTRRVPYSRAVFAREWGFVNVSRLECGERNRNKSSQARGTHPSRRPPLPKAGKSRAPASWNNSRRAAIQSGNGRGTRLFVLHLTYSVGDTANGKDRTSPILLGGRKRTRTGSFHSQAAPRVSKTQRSHSPFSAGRSGNVRTFSES